MRTRPRELTLLGVLLLLVAISMPLQILFVFGGSPFDFSSIAAKLAPLNWAVIFLSSVLAYLVFRASPLLLGVVPFFLGAVAWNNWLVASLGGEGEGLFPLLSTAGAFLMMGLLAFPNPRRVLANPRLRWWLTPPRRRVELEARVCPTLGGELIARTFDLSEGGAFIALRDSFWASLREGSGRNLSVGTYCSVRLSLNQVSAFSCMAQVVRRGEPAGAYPEGIGIRFISMTPREKKTLLSFLRNAPGTERAGMAVARS